MPTPTRPKVKPRLRWDSPVHPSNTAAQPLPNNLVWSIPTWSPIIPDVPPVQRQAIIKSSLPLSLLISRRPVANALGIRAAIPRISEDTVQDLLLFAFVRWHQREQQRLHRAIRTLQKQHVAAHVAQHLIRQRPLEEIHIPKLCFYGLHFGTRLRCVEAVTEGAQNVQETLFQVGVRTGPVEVGL